MPTTTYHGFNLPTEGGDADNWGAENNAAHQDWDTLTSGAQKTVLGRVAASVGPYTQLTATELATIPDAVVGDAGSGGLKGMVPAPAAGDAAARKVLRADGAWGSDEIKGWAVITGSSGAVVAGRNIACSRSAAGAYAITFSTALASANFAVLISVQSADPAIDYIVGSAGKSAAGFSVGVTTVGGGVGYDPAQIFLQVIAA